MGTLTQIAQFLLSISIIVVLHELAHLIAARLCKTRVEKFYLFFNPWFSIFKIKRKGVEYGLGWLPLGGYIKIAGMIDESMDKEQMKKPPQPDEFRSRPTWQRLIIILAGVVVNLFLAMLIFIGILYTQGENYLPAEKAKYGIVCSPLAKEMGLKDGDKILMIDNKPVEKFSEIVPTLIINDPKSVQVVRNGKLISIAIPSGFLDKFIDQSSRSFKQHSFISLRVKFSPMIATISKVGAAQKIGLQKGDEILSINGQKFTFYDEFTTLLSKHKNKILAIKVGRNNETLSFSTRLGDSGLLGIITDTDIKNDFDFETKKYTFFAAIPAGISYGNKMLTDYISSLRILFTTSSGYKALGGFGTIGSIYPKTWDWQVFWHVTAFLSIMLAFLNILPIPALDGGHAVFILYEMITNRPPNQKVLEFAQIAGFVLIIFLIILANGNDVIRWISS